MTAQLEAGGRTILIVDDDPIYRQVLAMGLEAAGYKTLAAENGERAIALVNESKPNVILVDMLMPVMDGMQFLRWVKDKAPEPIPTIVLTCLDRRTVAVDALVAGAADVLTKPFSLPLLLKKLSTIE
jgi:CheY-like chemotaxis protein